MDAPVTSTRADVKEVKADVKEVKADVKDVKAEIQTPSAVERVAAPTTTTEENRHALGQRRINLIWELTQAGIALSVIWGSIGSAIWMTVYDPMNRLMAFLFLSNVVSIVIGFYFGRTNHQRVGGVDLGR